MFTYPKNNRKKAINPNPKGQTDAEGLPPYQGFSRLHFEPRIAQCVYIGCGRVYMHSHTDVLNIASMLVGVLGQSILRNILHQGQE